MTKFSFLLAAFYLLLHVGNAQKIAITGSIKDSNNNPVSMASVTEEKTKNGVAADNIGHFSLSVSPNAKIYIVAIGFKDTAFVVKDAEPLNIILSASPKQLASVTVTGNTFTPQFSNQIKNEIFQSETIHYKMENNLSYGPSVYEGMDLITHKPYHVVQLIPSSHVYQGSALPEFHTKEDTKGSPYLFDFWLKGVVSNITDTTLIDDYRNLYNVNKMTGDLIMTRDFQSALTVDKSQIKFFTLYDSLKNTHSFMIVPIINKDLFCEVIGLGNNYDIFKLTTAKFVKADYHSNGLTSSGNNYDEYANTVYYYLFDLDAGTYKNFLLKKKSILSAFDNNKTVEQFFSNHKEAIDDNFLKALVQNIDTETKTQ